MELEEKKVELLHEAFSRFNVLSLNMERSYRLLEEQVGRLKNELEMKNQALNTSRKENEFFREQAERSHRLAAVGEMSARMAHELRNPLGSVELFASLLRKGLGDRPDQREWAEHISTAVAAMDHVLSNLLLFTSAPAPHFQKADFLKILEEARFFAIHLIQQNHIHFIGPGKTLSGPVWLDEDLLRQVFLNLILNAVEAMPNGGELEITAARRVMGDTEGGSGAPDEEKIVVTISDTGTGIQKEILSKIFDPFFTTKNKGTGLGLAIAHNAISALGGVMSVESEPGRGTRFTLIFPSWPLEIFEAPPGTVKRAEE